MHIHAQNEPAGVSPVDQYADLLRLVSERFALAMRAAPHDRLLYRTASPDLAALFAATLPSDELRRRHACRACDDFLRRYGGLVMVDEAGGVESPLWGPERCHGADYDAAIVALRRAVLASRVVGALVPEQVQLGVPSNPDRARGCTWSHLAVRVDTSMVHRSRAQDAAQRESQIAEERGMLGRIVGEWSTDHLVLILALADAGKLARDEKITGPARWLLDLINRCKHTRDRRASEALLWRAAATAPTGYAHARGGVLGSLVDDLTAGMAQDEVIRRSAARMAPDRYQRPQAPPTVGNVLRAAKLVADLGLEPALARRYARLDEVRPTWTPEPVKPAGVFGHLLPSAERPLQRVEGSTRVTWAKFSQTVLRAAERIELFVPRDRRNYCAFTTAVDPAAPPLVQWDREDARNPVSSYVFTGGSPPGLWSLRADAWHIVEAVVPLPWMWGDRPLAHHGEAVVLVLAGSRPVDHPPGGGFFVESLRSELHEVRATLEAHVKQARIEQPERACCGLAIGPNMPPVLARVTAGNVVTTYEIDRWD